MTTYSPSALQRLAAEILQAAGTPPDIADGVASVLIDNQLAGHESHGLLRLEPYLRWIDEGRIVADARPEVLSDHGGTALVRGHRGFGQTAALFATDLAIEKALEHRVAAVSVVDLGHTGRLAAFTDRAAARGVMMFMAVGSGGPAMTVPFGGAKPSLGTNPIAFSVPGGSGDAITLDYATSAIANGKLMLAATDGKQVPEGAIVTRDGSPTTDPNEYFNGGHLLPFGGHKGYALAVVADLLAGPLTGADAFSGAAMETGLFLFAVPADAFRPAADYAEAVDRVSERITDVPPAPWSDGVKLPGAPEAARRRERLESGVPVSADVWGEVSALARRLGLDPDELVR